MVIEKNSRFLGAFFRCQFEMDCHFGGYVYVLLVRPCVCVSLAMTKHDWYKFLCISGFRLESFDVRFTASHCLFIDLSKFFCSSPRSGADGFCARFICVHKYCTMFEYANKIVHHVLTNWRQRQQQQRRQGGKNAANKINYDLSRKTSITLITTGSFFRSFIAYAIINTTRLIRSNWAH